jgi:hypothetical protein
MTYTTAAKVQARLDNSNLGVAGSVTYDDTAMAEAIAEFDQIVNFELDLTSNTTDPRFTGILNNMGVDVIAMFILQARHFKENNEVESISNYWATTPDVTFSHRRKLRRIHRKIHGCCWSKSIHTGLNAQ